jgi:hypothetical protein
MLGAPGRFRDSWGDVLPGELFDMENREVQEVLRGGGLPGLPAGRTIEEEIAMRQAAQTVDPRAGLQVGAPSGELPGVTRDPRTGLRTGRPAELAILSSGQLARPEDFAGPIGGYLTTGAPGQRVRPLRVQGPVSAASNRQARPEDLAGPVRRFASPVSGETGEPVVGLRMRMAAEAPALSAEERVLKTHLDLERSGARRKNLNPGEGRWDDAALEVLQRLQAPEQMLAGNPDLRAIDPGRPPTAYSPGTQELVDIISSDQGRRAAKLGSLLSRAEKLQQTGGAGLGRIEKLNQAIAGSRLRGGEMFVDGLRVLTPVISPEQQLLDLHPLAITGPDYAQQRINRARGAQSLAEGLTFGEVGEQVAEGNLRIPRNADAVVDDIRIEGMGVWPASSNQGLTYGEAELRAQANADELGPIDPSAISLERRTGDGAAGGEMVAVPVVERDGSIRTRLIDPNIEIDGTPASALAREIKADTKTKVMPLSSAMAQGIDPTAVRAALDPENSQAVLLGTIPRVGGRAAEVWMPSPDDTGRRPTVVRHLPDGRDAATEVAENLVRIGRPTPYDYDAQRAKAVELLAQYGIRGNQGPVRMTPEAREAAGLSEVPVNAWEMQRMASGQAPGVRLREIGTRGPASPLASSITAEPRAVRVVRRGEGGAPVSGEYLVPQVAARSGDQAPRALTRWDPTIETGMTSGPVFGLDSRRNDGQLDRVAIEKAIRRQTGRGVTSRDGQAGVDNPATVQHFLAGLEQGSTSARPAATPQTVIDRMIARGRVR